MPERWFFGTVLAESGLTARADLTTSSIATGYLYTRRGYLLERYNNDMMFVYIHHTLPSTAPIVAITARSGFPDLLFVSDANGVLPFAFGTAATIVVVS